jgi:hypothetical protein
MQKTLKHQTNKLNCNFLNVLFLPPLAPFGDLFACFAALSSDHHECLTETPLLGNCEVAISKKLQKTNQWSLMHWIALKIQ